MERSILQCSRLLYDTDFVEWTAHVAGMLRQGRLDEMDLEHIAEEIEDLGKSERSAAASQLHRMLHLIKQTIQPEKGGSIWRRSIAEGRAEVEFKLEDSPSLRRYAEQNLERIWRKAVKNALFETGHSARRKDLDIPADCPYTLRRSPQRRSVTQRGFAASIQRSARSAKAA